MTSDKVAKKVAADKPLTDAETTALKSTDVEASTSERHVKVFVLPAGPKPTEENGFSHEANKAATVQYMLGVGLRPTGEVELDSITEQKTVDGRSIGWELAYSVASQDASKYDPETDPVYVVAPDVDEVPANTDNAPEDAGTGTPGTTVISGKIAE
jgi:hypothetical protein